LQRVIPLEMCTREESEDDDDRVSLLDAGRANTQHRNTAKMRITSATMTLKCSKGQPSTAIIVGRIPCENQRGGRAIGRLRAHSPPTKQYSTVEGLRHISNIGLWHELYASSTLPISAYPLHLGSNATAEMGRVEDVSSLSRLPQLQETVSCRLP